MSEENKSGSAAPQENVSQEQQQEQYVTRKAYEEVSRDMHKNKQKAKELEVAYNELQAQLKAQEEAKLHEQERWKELYEKREAELEQERKNAQEQQGRYLRSVKLSALKQEIGANIKDEYLSFANLDGIAFNEDGSIDKDSLHEVANSFRKEHGQLIPQTDNANITGQAPSSEAPAPREVDFSKMSSKERVEYYTNFVKNKQ